MSDFKVHVTSGVLTGVSVAAIGLVSQDLNPIQAGAIAILGTTGGIMPDLDSDTGKPLALLFQWLSVLIPVLVYPYIYVGQSMNTAFMLCYFPVFYLVIHGLLCPVVKRLTRHRGMMHSVPFALICTQAAYLLLVESGPIVAFYGGLSMFCGCMVHLILDEFQSVDLKFGFIVVAKRSSGSALKLTGGSVYATIMAYAILSLMTLLLITAMFPELKSSIPGLDSFG